MGPRYSRGHLGSRSKGVPTENTITSKSLTEGKAKREEVKGRRKKVSGEESFDEREFRKESR